MNNLHKDHYLVYNRKSTDDAENQRNSLPYQRQRNLEYALREHLSIAMDLTIQGFCTNGIIDESHSEFKEDEEFDILADGSVQYRILRPKFLKLAELLKSKAIKGAIFLCWDRASRNPQDDLIIKKLIRLGCDIRFTEATYDKSSAGDLHRDIDGVFAAHYSRNISEKVKNAQKKLRAERRCIYATPIGYLDRGSASKPLDPERAPNVRRIFELYATGEWSMSQLAKWAQRQGLTKKPARRKRTTEEIANNVDLASIPKLSRPVDHKTIEYILSNPFYIGKIKVGTTYADSTAHQPLIDTALFLRVQKALRERRVSVRYIDKPFFTYRGLSHCGACGRAYTPYLQKGITYYRSRCREGCPNADPNLNEEEVTDAVATLLGKVSFTDQEIYEIERRRESEAMELAAKRTRAVDDLYARRRTVLADMEYLAENRVTLIRTAAMSAEDIQREESRLKGKLLSIQNEMASYAENVPEMIKDILTFSELVKYTKQYIQHALDSEKREIAAVAFSELSFKDRRLVGYKARDGFKALLTRTFDLGIDGCVTISDKPTPNGLTGSLDYLFSELYSIHPLVMNSIKCLTDLGCGTTHSFDQGL